MPKKSRRDRKKKKRRSNDAVSTFAGGGVGGSIFRRRRDSNSINRLRSLSGAVPPAFRSPLNGTLRKAVQMQGALGSITTWRDNDGAKMFVKLKRDGNDRRGDALKSDMDNIKNANDSPLDGGFPKNMVVDAGNRDADAVQGMVREAFNDSDASGDNVLHAVDRKAVGDDSNRMEFVVVPNFDKLKSDLENDSENRKTNEAYGRILGLLDEAATAEQNGDIDAQLTIILQINEAIKEAESKSLFNKNDRNAALGELQNELNDKGQVLHQALGASENVAANEAPGAYGRAPLASDPGDGDSNQSIPDAPLAAGNIVYDRVNIGEEGAANEAPGAYGRAPLVSEPGEGDSNQSIPDAPLAAGNNVYERINVREDGAVENAEQRIVPTPGYDLLPVRNDVDNSAINPYGGLQGGEGYGDLAAFNNPGQLIPQGYQSLPITQQRLFAQQGYQSLPITQPQLFAQQGYQSLPITQPQLFAQQGYQSLPITQPQLFAQQGYQSLPITQPQLFAQQGYQSLPITQQQLRPIAPRQLTPRSRPLPASSAASTFQLRR